MRISSPRHIRARSEVHAHTHNYCELNSTTLPTSLPSVLIRLSTVRSPQSAHCLTGMKFGELVEITEENGDWCAPRLPHSHSLFEAFCVGWFAHHLSLRLLSERDDEDV